MDKMHKLLRKIQPKDALRISIVLEKIDGGNVSNLDILKLKGFTDVFRVRVGDYRVIFRKGDTELMILEISKRSDTTYKNF